MPSASRMLIVLLLSPLAAFPDADRPGSAPRDYPIQPVPFTAVHVKSEFWTPRLETNRQTTVWYDFKRCEETGRIDNFAKAGGLMKGDFRGIPFDDSDVYKVIEGASYTLAIQPDPKLDQYLDDLIAKIAAAQEADGYLYTARRLLPPEKLPGMSGKARWHNEKDSHELYNVGHLYEAAAAHFQATGKRTLLDVALKSADLVAREFQPGKLQNPPGHEGIEMGLVKLTRVTGDPKYLALAKFLIDIRGRADTHKLYGAQYQDHQPVIEQEEAVGHAVRAGYLYSGMADVAALTGDAAYLQAVDRLWENVVAKKLYLTGGIGARHGGESFGEAYELPNATAYNETCAAIANALWNHRMFLLHGDAKYLDVLERTIYNGFLSGVALTGDQFFYPNPLASHGGYKRSPWFGCACCPVNVVRFLPGIAGYIYAVRENAAYVNLFIGGTGAVKLPGTAVTLTQETRYPWDGQVRIAVDPERAAKFALKLRIPGWALDRPVPGDLYRYLDTPSPKESIHLRVNGQPAGLTMADGFAVLDRDWKKGDVVELILPMPVRRVVAHDSVKDDRGLVAIERGPLLYCVEEADNGKNLFSLVLGDDVALAPEHRPDLLGGVTMLRAGDLTAIPYYAWCHRGAGKMNVWLARTADKAAPLPRPTIASESRPTASHVFDLDHLEALNDQVEPKNSVDLAIPRFTWWDHKGTAEWAQYDFAKPTKVSSVEVYWFDDTGRGACRVPQSWRLLYRSGDTWKPVEQPGDYGLARDTFNKVTFAAVETSALRLEVQLQKDFSGGILEWKLAASGETPAAGEINRATLDQWSAPYRGWHYQPDHVIPAQPKIPGHEKFHSTDVPCVYQLPGQPDKWFMSFIAFNGQGYNSFVAESTNLLQWTNPRLAMGFGKPGEFDFGGTVIGAFLYESYDIKAPRVLKKRDGKFWTLYGCYAKQGAYEIDPGYEGVASSADGLAWQRASDAPILSVHQADCAEWEKHCIYQPWLVEHEGAFFNFYNAKHMPDWIEQMGMARSTDLLNWKRHEGNPVVRVRKGGYDDKFCSDGKVFRDGDHWVMFYFGVGKGGAHIMAAFSRDLLHWTAHPEPLYTAGGHPGGLDKQYAHKISLVYNPKNETFYMYYCACGAKGRGIGLITSKPVPQVTATAADAINILPQPRKIEAGAGRFALTAGTGIAVQSLELQAIGSYLAEVLKSDFGLALSTGAAAGGIALRLDAARADLGDEGYSLTCTTNGIVIAAPRPAGVFYGVQTLRQLPVIAHQNLTPGGGRSVPCATIEDRPRFPWRGYLLDPARHFRTKDELKRYVDLLAFQKLNMLQLHLTDEQGWRVEIKRYPKLTEIGARRKDCSGKTGEGWFYTQDDIRDLVSYAASRFVTIVPEIEMPGHSGAAVASYPELGCGGKPSPYLCPAKEGTLEFATNVLAEIADLFPSPFIHIGADEVQPEPWRSCPDCGPRMQALAGTPLPARVQVQRVGERGAGVPFNENVARLQGEFVRRIDGFLQSRGRRMVGWDEILEGGLDESSPAVAMAWRSIRVTQAALALNRDVVASPHPIFYLDNDVSLRDTYLYEPLPVGTDAAQAAHLLGVQGNMWGERTATILQVDNRTFPRLCAIAEIGWSAAGPRDFDSFAGRLRPFLKKLEAMGVTPGAGCPAP